MHKLLLIPFCIILGGLARASRLLPARSVYWLNRFIIFGPLPALAFLNIRKMTLDASAFFPIGTAWLIFAGALAIFPRIGRREKWNRDTIGAAILMGGLGNTSFIGYPVVQSLYGAEGLKIGVLVDQPGSFLVFATLGMATAAYCSPFQTQGNSQLRLGTLLFRIFSFPAIWAVLLAIPLRNQTLPSFLSMGLSSLGFLLAPLALFSIGLQWNPAAIVSVWRANANSSGILQFQNRATQQLRVLAFCLLYKLALGPALIALLFKAFLFWKSGVAIDPLVFRVSILEAAMAPMITGGILAADYGLDPELVPLILGVGIPVSLFTVGIWALALNWIF